jgi:hypothetical protein
MQHKEFQARFTYKQVRLVSSLMRRSELNRYLQAVNRKSRVTNVSIRHRSSDQAWETPSFTLEAALSILMSYSSLEYYLNLPLVNNPNQSASNAG